MHLYIITDGVYKQTFTHSLAYNGITHMHTFVNIYTCTCKYINRSTVAYIYIYINAHTCLLIQCMGSTRDTQEKVFKICLILSVCTNSTTIL